ncbi:MAG TPA: dienelactone hydrolase family protein [Acidimicrobiales bacterium]|nr:dienelactone hydrolase family protein [Acidimicrobiales bacterium]
MREQLPSGTPVEVAGPSDAAFGLVVIPDIGGLRPLFDDLVARLAGEQGWAVAAPEPFPGRESMTLEERFAALSEVDDARFLGDVRAAADRTGAPTVGVLGFCMGGMYSLKAAGTGRFAAAVSFYGMIRVPEQWRGAGQADPIELLRRERACPVLAIIGGRDQWTPGGDVEDLAAVEGVQVEIYPQAEHGFAHDPSRPAHRPDDAADAWSKAIAFLRAHGS